MSEHREPIPSRIYNAAVGGHICGTEDIIDDIKNKTQKQINSEVEESLGTGGSVDSRISSAVATETTRAQAAEEDRYTKAETYSKTELNNMITTPNQEYVSVIATDQTTAVTDVLPATGAADTIYRVGNWDGSQFDVTVYSEYAWNGSAYIKLSTKSQIGEVYDISANHADTKYANLAAALGTNGANIPQSLRKGGMSVKFVQSSDNNYVQYRLMANSFSTTISDWQRVDECKQAAMMPGQNLEKYIIENSYIATNLNIGEIVDTTTVYLSGWNSICVPYIANRQIKITGLGGNIPRLWAFLDKDKKLVSHSDDTVNLYESVISSNVDGWFVVNYIASEQHSVTVFDEIFCNDVCMIENQDLTKFIIKDSYIVTGSTTIGQEVNTSRIYSSEWDNLMIPYIANTKIKITGEGGNAARLWAFLDKDKKLVDKSSVNANVTNNIIQCDTDGYLIITLLKTTPYSVLISSSIDNITKALHTSLFYDNVKSGTENFIDLSKQTSENIIIDSYIGTYYLIYNNSNIFYISSFIPVAPNRIYKGIRIANPNYASLGGFYNEYKGFIKHIDYNVQSLPISPNEVTFTTPDDCYYVRLNMYHYNDAEHELNKMLVKGDSPIDTYRTYGYIMYESSAQLLTELKDKLLLMYTMSDGQDLTEFIILNHYIYTNVEVGEIVDTTPIYNNAWDCLCVPYLANKQIKITGEGGNAARLWAFLDKDKKLVSKASQDYHTTDTCISSNVNGWLVMSLLKTVPYSVIVESSNSINEQYLYDLYRFKDKKGSFIGDSITYGYTPGTGAKIENNWVKLVSDKLRLATSNNYGINSSTIAVKESSPTERNPMVDRVSTIDATSDLVVVAGGTNDWAHSWTPFGDINTDKGNSATRYTFCGALDILCRELIERFPDKQIAFLTPIKRDSSGTNSVGKKLIDYVDAIKSVCQRYGIPVFDMFTNICINPTYEGDTSPQYSLLIPDGTHPNEEGHAIMAKGIFPFLNNL